MKEFTEEYLRNLKIYGETPVYTDAGDDEIYVTWGFKVGDSGSRTEMTLRNNCNGWEFSWVWNGEASADYTDMTVGVASGDELSALVAFVECRLRRMIKDGEVFFEVVKDAVSDVDRNFYDAVVVGNRMWMTSNLRVKRFNTGGTIPESYMKGDGKFMHSLGAVFGTEGERKFGMLYNRASVDSGALAPEGWRVATADDWKDLFVAVANKMPDSRSDVSPHLSVIAGALCSKTGWNDSRTPGSPGYERYANNKSGMCVYPVPPVINGECVEYGEAASFWCAGSGAEGECMSIYRPYERVAHNRVAENMGEVYMSVRCVKDL